MGVAPVRIANPLCYNIRQVSTIPPKKAPKAASPAAPSKEKTPKLSAGTAKPKKASTKAAAAPELPVPVAEVPKAKRPAKKAQAPKSADTATRSGEEAKPVPLTEQQGAGKSKSATPTKAKTASTPAATTQAAAASTTRVAPKSAVYTTGTSNPGATPTTRGAKPKIDPSSPEYKQAARKWVATIIALPVLIVTSYFLFERCELQTSLAWLTFVKHEQAVFDLGTDHLPSGLGQ